MSENGSDIAAELASVRQDMIMCWADLVRIASAAEIHLTSEPYNSDVHGKCTQAVRNITEELGQLAVRAAGLRAEARARATIKATGKQIDS